jgi:hypothetical protein
VSSLPAGWEITHLHYLAPPAHPAQFDGQVAGVQQVQVSPPSAVRNDTAFFSLSMDFENAVQAGSFLIDN